MTPNQKRKMWLLVADGAAIAAGMATRSAIKKGWRQLKKCDPPENPDSKDVTWVDALVWTALTGAAVGVSRMLITRYASLSLDRFTELEPPDDSLPGVED